MALELEEALLSGVPIGSGQLAHCNCCGACLRPNHRIEVLVLLDGTTVEIVTTRVVRVREDNSDRRRDVPAGSLEAGSPERSTVLGARD